MPDTVLTESASRAEAPLPWHEAAWDRLHRQRTAGLLPHAVLLVGPPGTGKAAFAGALARALLCAGPENRLPCGACHACRLSAAGNHGDFLWVQPVGDNRAIRVDQVRQSIGFGHGTASLGGRKVVVFAPADRMNVNGFNALLKSLEEPPRETYLLLVCDRLQGVPATIRSRCQVMRLPAPERMTAIEWLNKRVPAAADVDRALELADDSPLLAERLLLEGSVQALASRREALRRVMTGAVAVPEVWHLWSEREPGEFLAEVAATLRTVLRDMPPDLLSGHPGRATFGLLDEIHGLQRAVVAGANPGRQLLVDVLLEKCHRELGTAHRGASILRSADSERSV